MRLHTSQRGMALISALLLLLIITVLGVGMFRSFGMQERIAGNTREKQKALHSANAAEAYAEWWLSTDAAINATTGVTCGGGTVNYTVGEVCSNTLNNSVTNGNVATVPWLIGGSEAAVTYTPPNFTVETTAGVMNGYYEAPRYYISFISQTHPAPNTTTNVYQIDAAGYGSSPSAVAVVETGYVVSKINSVEKGQQVPAGLGGP
jgi:type IV pilus assembly protein PilX